MAKRRKLQAPDPTDLANFEARFRRETTASPVAPISAMAADSAAAADLRDVTERAKVEQIRVDAEAFSDAKAEGRVLLDVPLDQIDDTAIVRDRAVLDEGELSELRDSISRHGLRLPVEIFLRSDLADGKVYGLLSGYRRLLAIRQLHETTQLDVYDSIKAVLRDPETMGGRFAAMVEENEIRANLSHFERGRIAVIAAGQGVYPNVEAAVDALFPAASKAKRSKVRSFALVFEELGDLLAFPEAMTEKQGLRIASALRDGGEGVLREPLERLRPEGFDQEWAALESVLTRLEADATPNRARGGRPAGRVRKTESVTAIELSNGISVVRSKDAQGHVLRLRGPGLDDKVVDAVIAEVRHILERSV